MNREISGYIGRQPPVQREIIKAVRKLFFNTLPDCEEVYRWGVITFSDGKFYIAGMKERVHIGFSIKGLTREEIMLFEGSGKTMRHIKINNLREIDIQKLTSLIRLVYKKVVCSS